MKSFTIYALSFCTNAAILIFEIAGGRLLAPYIGTSVGVWAGLIAVILGGMAVGYHFGGRFGDEDASPRRIGLVVLAAGMMALLSWGMRDFLPTALGSEYSSPVVGAIVLGALLFMPTVILLAAVSPMLAKNLIRRLEHSAQAVGTLNAVGTTGAIVGAVATGIFLISFFGVGMILLGVAVSLILCGLVLYGRWSPRLAAVIACATASALLLNALPTKADGWIAEVSSAYNRIVITEGGAGDGTRAVWTSPFGMQCQMYVDGNGRADESRLSNRVEKAHDVLITALFPEGPRRALFLGGCVGAFPRYLARKYPDMDVDMVEIDPAMTEVARDYFGFDAASFPTLTVTYEDARTFVNRDHASYDLVYIDAFGSSGRVPFQLVTEEMFGRLAKHAKDDGLLVMNTHGSYEGPGSVYPAIFVKTARSAFRNVALYQFTGKPFASQNLVIVASNGRELPDELADPRYPELALIRVGTPDNVIVLTDNYAPVEGLLPVEKLILNE